MEYVNTLLKNAAYLYVDESQDGDQNDVNLSLYLCASLILSEDKEEIASKLNETKKSFKDDQFIGVRKKSVSKLLHYNDDNEEIKTKFTDAIRMMFFKSYISRLKFNNQSYDHVYCVLLKKILKDRIIKYKDRVLFVRYEQNSKISKEGVISTVNSILKSIKSESKHVIKTPPVVEEITKDDLLISIPDYSLGLFLTYKKEKNNKNAASFKINRFEKIRSKIRLFVDLNSSDYYSRKSGKRI